ncbi:hypothetical protein DFP72DRAFT_874754 [Ephemerocybe angulata]|uniref:SET domain-containing protein n=1 Tax=Ephemerocybe angulata TaxID=980116 RepID=A0A8H6ICP5_9AGAR|nr:hypothetical protein DFP72DRAFT_874754 [Tulosesus angulatus]
MVHAPQTCEALLIWFQKQGGTVDLTSVGLVDFPNSEGGRGAIALKDIPEGHVLFSIPRDLTLSTRTSSLPNLFGLDEWKRFKLDEGWSGLILSMMWEAAQGPKSKWSEYMSILPTSFDTPMFWDEKDLAELQGTSIVSKLGKEDAEEEYKTKLVPALESRPDLFPSSERETHYSFHAFHLMGSRILSRSFDVEKWQGDEDEDENEMHEANTSMGSAMDVDENRAADPHPHRPEGEEHDEEEHEEGEEEEGEQDSSDTAMVPMADMLNARFGSENAKLFHERTDLKMIATKPIKAGEQIWNTYGDLPNSELLRRYGHVDIMALPNGEQGNPGDVVEIRADGILKAVHEIYPNITEESFSERIDWWLEEGEDDVFDFDWDLELPDPALAIICLFLLSEAEWIKAREKSKPPKPKADTEVLTTLKRAIQDRLKDYLTSVVEDEALLQRDDLTLNHRQAIVVRLGEKKILDSFLTKIAGLVEQQSNKAGKRKHETEAPVKGHGKKSKR